MQKAVDYLELWRELCARQEKAWLSKGSKDPDERWKERAQCFDVEVKRRWAEPNSSRDFVAAQLRANPDWTALDIGGGTGAWAILMAQSARRVTVVEPSPAMLEVMRRNLADANVRNVQVLERKWPDVQVERHDLVLCSHSMFGFADFAGFIRSIEAVARKICVLIMRSPSPNDLLCIATRHVWGQPYDSPNFQVGYNALLQIGIFPNVLMEDSGLWDPWTSQDLDEAIAEAKRRLGLLGDSRHDDYLHNLLKQKLTKRNDRLEWPRSIRSALLFWSPGPCLNQVA
jgi:SAM-dependent methyltransferase